MLESDTQKEIWSAHHQSISCSCSLSFVSIGPDWELEAPEEFWYVHREDMSEPWLAC